MDKLKVYISNRQDDVKIPTGIRMLIRRCCHAVIDCEKFGGDVEVSVSFVSEKEIKDLNKLHRNKDMVTDVLSFPLGENGIYEKNPKTGASILGDVVICVKRACEQAKSYGHNIQREISFLTVHSMFHLLGYDHVNGGLEQLLMREKEEFVLSQLGMERAKNHIID